MLNNQTIEGLYALRLPAMASGLIEQRERADYQALSFEERLGLLVDREIAERDSRRLERYLKQAKLRTNAVVEDVDFRRRRGLDRAQFLGLAEAGFVKSHHDVVIVGPTGLGKTYLACALANSAIRRGHNALYLRGPRMLEPDMSQHLAKVRVAGSNTVVRSRDKPVQGPFRGAPESRQGGSVGHPLAIPLAWLRVRLDSIAIVSSQLAHTRASTTLNVYAHAVPGGDRAAAESSARGLVCGLD
jgi:hypothetical protein